ncbi:MAG: hypothetical protein U5L02_18380 [Rheinheimera sp.]|nr:hypothetical protein [Rheinheimera sp.]
MLAARCSLLAAYIILFNTFKVQAATPDGYFAFASNNSFEYSLDHNGNGIFEAKLIANGFLNTAMGNGAVALYFPDGSYIMIDTKSSLVTTTDQPDRTGQRKTTNYHIDFIHQAWNYWKITNKNRSILGEFFKFSNFLALNQTSFVSNFSGAGIYTVPIDTTPTALKVSTKVMTADSDPLACQEELKEAVKGYMGSDSYLGCVGVELLGTVAAGVAFVASCAPTPAALLSCGPATVAYAAAGTVLLIKSSQCESAKTEADENLETMLC